MKLFRNALCLCLLALLITACNDIKNEASDVMREVGELKESVVETGEGMVDGAKKAVDDAKEALEKTKEKVDGMVDVVGDAKEKVENLVPSGDMEDSATEEKTLDSDDSQEEVEGTFKYQSGSIKWEGQKIGGAHEGTIDVKSGMVEVDDGELEEGEFVVDMTTINVTDLEGGSKDTLEGKLNGEGYFDVANHPESTLEIEDVEDGEVSAELTIKGITHPISFPAEIIVKEDTVKFAAEFSIDRTKWDIAKGNVALKKEINYWVDLTLGR